MNLEEYISYKTSYYFFKGELSLDPYFYNDITNKFQDFANNGYQIGDFYKIYELVDNNKNMVLLLKTKYGNIVFKEWIDNESVCDFLTKATKQCSGAMFLTHRVSDSHQVVLAENGNIIRNICYMEDEQILEGEQTEFEKKNNFNFKLDENGFFVESIDEDFVYDFSKDFMGFDKDEDLEILDFKVFEFELFRKQEKVDSNISDDIVYKILNNIERQNIDDAKIHFIKFEDDNMMYIRCIHKFDEENYSSIYTNNIPNIKNKKDFKNLLFCCLNQMSRCDFSECEKATLDDYLFSRMINEFNYDMCSLIMDNEDKGDLFVSLTMKDKVQLNNDEIAKNMIAIRNFKPKNWKILHKFLLKKLKPRKISKVDD